MFNLCAYQSRWRSGAIGFERSACAPAKLARKFTNCTVIKETFPRPPPHLGPIIVTIREDPYAATMPGKVKAYELQSKCAVVSVKRRWDIFSDRCSLSGVVRSFRRTKVDLVKQLAELKEDLLKLRVQKIAGGSAAKLTKMFVSPCSEMVQGKC